MDISTTIEGDQYKAQGLTTALVTHFQKAKNLLKTTRNIPK